MEHETDSEATSVDHTSSKVAGTEPRNWSLIIRLALAGLVIALFVVFLFQNADTTEVNFLGWDASLPTSVLMLICTAIGALVWQTAGFVSRRARKA